MYMCTQRCTAKAENFSCVCTFSSAHACNYVQKKRELTKIMSGMDTYIVTNNPYTHECSSGSCGCLLLRFLLPTTPTATTTCTTLATIATTITSRTTAITIAIASNIIDGNL